MDYTYEIANSNIIIKAKKSNCEKKNVIARIPNRLIWEINSFLAYRFQLYEIVIDRKKKCKDESIIGRSDLVLQPLDDIYIHASNISENDLIKEYELHKNEDISFSLFKEIYSIELINFMEYIAIDKRDSDWKANLFKRNESIKHTRKDLLQVANAYITITDHEIMNMAIKDKLLLDELAEVVDKFSDKSYTI